MNTHIFFATNDDGSQTAILGSSGQPRSMLADLTSAESAALNDWSAAQHGDPARGGAIDLMQWPGWLDVLARRVRERVATAKAAG